MFSETTGKNKVVSEGKRSDLKVHKKKKQKFKGEIKGQN